MKKKIILSTIVLLFLFKNFFENSTFARKYPIVTITYYIVILLLSIIGLSLIKLKSNKLYLLVYFLVIIVIFILISAHYEIFKLQMYIFSIPKNGG